MVLSDFKMGILIFIKEKSKYILGNVISVFKTIIHPNLVPHNCNEYNREIGD